MSRRDHDRFKPYDQHQGQLLPAYVGDSLDPSDPVFFVDEAVDALNLTAFEARYAQVGERAYSPRLLLKMWLFGVTQGVYSGREIARRLGWDLRFRFLLGSSAKPDFRTINRFRVRHAEDFADVLKQTIDLARKSGLVRLGMVTVDGTKIRANTSRNKAMSHGRMVEEEERLAEEIKAITKRLEEVNAEEDRQHGDDDDGGYNLPKELQDRKKRRERIRQLRQQLEEEKGEDLEDRHQKSFADTQAEIMKTADDSFHYCYNAQAAVSADGLIVAAELTRKAGDVSELVPMTQAVEKNVGQRPDLMVADKGYLSENVLEQMEKMGQRCLVATGREGKAEAKWPRQPYTQAMVRTLRLPWAKQAYRHRKTQGERPFAEIKGAMRFRRFMLRGTVKVTGEWWMASAGYNLRRLFAHKLQTA
jgi:transposase